MIKERVIVFFVISLIFSLGIASAGMIISQDKGLYNVGDEMALKVLFDSGKKVSDYLTLSLNCEGNVLEIYKSPMVVNSGEQKEVNLNIGLDKGIIKQSIGSCFVSGKFDSQEASGNSFEISSLVYVNFTSIEGIYSPKDSLYFSGNAFKKNGNALQGIVEAKSSQLGIEMSGGVVNGVFNLNMTIPENASAGNYSILIRVYDEGYNGEIANLGEATSLIYVRQVLTSLDVALSAFNFTPIENVTYSVIALDQSGNYMEVLSSVNVIGFGGENIQFNVLSGEMVDLKLHSNSTPGTWSISANSEGLSTIKEFYLQEYKHIKYVLIGSVLNVLNDGNVPYSGPVEIKIDDKIFLEHIDLGIGEFNGFDLHAPDGEYEILVDDGKSGSQVVGKSFLTGRAISVGETNSSFDWLWVLLIILLGLGIGFYYYKFVKEKNYGYTMKSPKISLLNPVRADVIESGKRERASILVLNVRNSSQLAGNQQFASILGSAIGKARDMKVNVSREPNGFTLIFSPTLMGGRDLTLSASEFAGNLANEINEYNRKFNTPADYGIGVNEGELAVEYRNGIFKYMSVSNTIAVARKLADSAKKEALISNSVHSLTRARVKVERAVDGWRITSTKDNSQYSDFIAKFKQRQTRGF